MSMRTFVLIIAEKIGNLLHKDTMKYRIKRFRLLGANIGQNVRAFSKIGGAEPYLINVGDNVTVAPGVSFITHDNSAIKLNLGATDFVGAITIGNNCFVGMNTILMPGVTIADNCIIGAGSVVTKSVMTPGTIVAGNPAKEVGTVEKLKAKNIDKCFCFKDLSYGEKKKMILDNKDKWINK